MSSIVSSSRPEVPSTDMSSSASYFSVPSEIQSSVPAAFTNRPVKSITLCDLYHQIHTACEGTSAGNITAIYPELRKESQLAEKPVVNDTSASWGIFLPTEAGVGIYRSPGKFTTHYYGNTAESLPISESLPPSLKVTPSLPQSHSVFPSKSLTPSLRVTHSLPQSQSHSVFPSESLTHSLRVTQSLPQSHSLSLPQSHSSRKRRVQGLRRMNSRSRMNSLCTGFQLTS